ncbi:hypothetical protein A2316_01660 [Candidatus Falkowbacteria bacterium RIFOXYB2_FULL_38_15]|uniref:Uncharacterized protein n=1 Tax=Candidatus Falkowbacteria bacterium RIFOXYA2_FULL_38_12 TaxID=1797993 RepID=A0A1F5S1S2_9BACT|nr:MAG: hypothetical protein A2257_04090 [Candidatus Falkowbacteria bacterium RIFOXYA2_FULL_38_12]OGF32941.1 MAG: hypothetical protein A2316_01660 [Candidatus Falkowbacteria bacterium RIFOXYB2_FULL_38_15]OGF44105.1 MAG: hypothetical protein A2555_01800 [Candidatus Falkowbacteria bacterium RIFOXYD2_FULL_39_16]
MNKVFQSAQNHALKIGREMKKYLQTVLKIFSFVFLAQKKFLRDFFVFLFIFVFIFSNWSQFLFFSETEEAQAAESTIDTTTLDATDEYGPSPSVVFTTSLIGYIFYIDASTQDLVYKVTADGGVSWGLVVTIDSATTGWTKVAVWYDQWTPGDTTGTKIHIAASDDASDDIFYTFLDTSTDTLKGSMVSVISGTTTLDEDDDGSPGITKGAGGALFLSGNFTNTAGGKISKSTDGAGDTWGNITPSTWSSVNIDQIQLLSLKTGNDIIAIKDETGSDAIKYQIYDETNDTWPDSWSNIATLVENTTYDQWFSASIKKSTGDVFLTFASYTGDSTNDIEFWSFDDSSRGGGFSKQTNLFNNDATVMMPVPIIDENNGDIYVSYLRGTLGDTMHVYFKKSANGGSTWSDESVRLNEFGDDHKSLRGNFLSDGRLYIVWYNDDLNDIYGSTVMTGIEVSIDASITDTTDEFSPSPSVVFTTDQIGYVFYIDVAEYFSYKKTTDGGKNWDNIATSIDGSVYGTSISVWYDQWTPGDISGTKIHIAVSDDSSDDIYYTYLDTSTDTLKGSVVMAVSGTTTITESVDGPPSITRGAGGALFVSANFTDTVGGKVSKSTDGVGDTWSDITPSTWSSVARDQIQLLPLKTGDDIIAIKAQTANNAIKYQIYNETADTWPDSWSSIATLVDHTIYDQWFSATINKTTGDVFLALADYTDDSSNNIELWNFDDFSREDGFTQKTNLFTNDATVMMPVPITDQNYEVDNKNIYVAYLRGTLDASVNVYYKLSTDGGANWGSESSALGSGMVDDIRYLRGNLLNKERLYAVWYNNDLDNLMGNTVIDLTSNNAPSLSISQPDGISDTVTIGDTFNITYGLSDGEQVVTVDFYYDSTGSGLDGTAIDECQNQVEGIGGTTCEWDTTGMVAGEYYVYGITSDGIALDVNDYSSGVITIESDAFLITDIVNVGYSSVGSPTMAMSSGAFSLACQTTTGSFGTNTERIYVNNNNGANNGWTLTLAAETPATDVWDGAASDFDYNDPGGGGCTDTVDVDDADSVGGQMTVNPSTATLTVGQCGACDTDNVSKGSSASFDAVAETPVNSITILAGAASSDDIGDWVLQGVSISQKIPGEQGIASDYDIDMVLTITAVN